MRNARLNRRGFTLLEVSVVLIIISTLVLLSSSNFLEKKNEAEVNVITSDIERAEQALEAHILKHGKLGKTHSNKGFKVFNSYVMADDEVRFSSFYDVNGRVDFNIVKAIEENFYIVSEVIESSFGEEGDFLADKEGKVYFLYNINAIGKYEEKIEEEEEEEEEVSPEEEVYIDVFTFRSPIEIKKADLKLRAPINRIINITTNNGSHEIESIEDQKITINLQGVQPNPSSASSERYEVVIKVKYVVKRT